MATPARKKLAKEVKEAKTEIVETVTSAQFCVTAIKTCVLIVIYYAFSITLTFYNKKFIHEFKFPLSITMTHLVIKFMFSEITRCVLECIKKEHRVTLSWKQYIIRVAPPGIASSLDIGLSNWSLEYISISLYTMTKSTVIVFIMAFALLFGLEKPRWSIVVVVSLISFGLFMFTYESTDFHAFGFALVLTASFLSGLRWTLSQLVLQKHEIGLSNPVDMIYHIQPWMIMALMPLSIGIEGIPISVSRNVFFYKDGELLVEHLAILLAGAVIAFGLELSEFLLVSNTSSLTLSISGVVKEVVTLLLASVIYNDPMNWLNGLGLGICLSGIFAHVMFKVIHASPTHAAKEEREEKGYRLLARDGHANHFSVSEDDSEDEDIFIAQRKR